MHCYASMQIVQRCLHWALIWLANPNCAIWHSSGIGNTTARFLMFYHAGNYTSHFLVCWYFLVLAYQEVLLHGTSEHVHIDIFTCKALLCDKIYTVSEKITHLLGLLSLTPVLANRLVILPSTQHSSCVSATQILEPTCPSMTVWPYSSLLYEHRCILEVSSNVLDQSSLFLLSQHFGPERVHLMAIHIKKRKQPNTSWT